jgi:hypothetical protein
MWFRRANPKLDRDGFDCREIVCADEESAKTEAARQGSVDDADQAEWIYLRNASGQWVARRTPRHLTPRRMSISEMLAEVFNPFSGWG